MAKSGAPKLVDVAASRVGRVRAYRVVAFMVSWQMARVALDRDTITLAEYREWWRESERTAYRDQAYFREAFPGETTPDRLLDAVLATWDQRRGVQSLANAPLSARVAV